MNDLFKATVKLAHAQPKLRPHLLPLLRAAQEDEDDSGGGEKEGKFEKGKSVDVGKWLRDNGHGEVAKKWDKYEGTLGKGEKKASAGPTARHFIAFASQEPSNIVPMLPLIREATLLPFLNEDMLVKMASSPKFAEKWKNMPKGWTEESRKKFWASLTGDADHKVTACIDKMKDKLGAKGEPGKKKAGAFCASLKDRIEGTTKWRGEGGKEATDEWLTVDEVRKHCPPCADKLAAQGVKKVKASVLKKAMDKAAAAQKKSQ